MENQQNLEARPHLGPRIPLEADENFVRLKGDESVIPDGFYCYSRDPSRPIENGAYPIVTCPYWALDPVRRNQDDGYCAHLKSGDWDSEGVSLLWDQVKECRIRDDISEDDEDEA